MGAGGAFRAGSAGRSQGRKRAQKAGTAPGTETRWHARKQQSDSWERIAGTRGGAAIRRVPRAPAWEGCARTTAQGAKAQDIGTALPSTEGL